MTTWQFAVIIACAVAGFWLVSFVIEAFGSKSKMADQPNGDFGKENLRSGDEAGRELKWFEVLDVAPNASVDEIKSAYRERARQYHPDRVQGLGVELREIAERKMKQLNEAYDFALRGR